MVVTVTKKDFEELARAIRQISNYEERSNVAGLVARVCRENNPRFDWGKFRSACNV